MRYQKLVSVLLVCLLACAADVPDDVVDNGAAYDGEVSRVDQAASIPPPQRIAPTLFPNVSGWSSAFSQMQFSSGGGTSPGQPSAYGALGYFSVVKNQTYSNCSLTGANQTFTFCASGLGVVRVNCPSQVSFGTGHGNGGIGSATGAGSWTALSNWVSGQYNWLQHYAMAPHHMTVVQVFPGPGYMLDCSYAAPWVTLVAQ